jgi:uncharacterized protein (TIGR03437 family)
MKLSSTALALLVAALIATPVLAQTQIGGGVCNSSTLTGTYALSMSGRQVTSTGTFTSVLQADGSATFDGQSTVTIAVSENTNQAVGSSLNWSGTYSVQANCAAVVNITSGGNATLNVMVFNQGKNFLMAGNDATYSYTGDAVTQSATQPTGCSTATLTGAYTFNGTGFGLSTNAVSSASDGAGLLQFDGQGNVTANITTSSVGAAGSPLALTGTYTMASNCIGSATLSDSSSHSYGMSFSIYSLTATNTNFYASLARLGNLLLTGGGHTVSTQPVAGTCSNSTLNGTYSLSLSGRGISAAGNFAGSYQGIGMATFDGSGNVTLAGTTNTNLAQGKTFSYSGTYSLAGSCSGTLTVTTTSSTTFTLLAWSGGSQFNIVGADGNYVYSGTGNNSEPVGCADASLSGTYTFTGSGFTLSGTTQNGSEDEAGVLQFDGQGQVTAAYKDTESGATPVSLTASGTYTTSYSCLASATLADSSGNSQTLNFVIGGLHGETLDMLAASSQFVRTGTAHSAFTNPSQAIGNVASYAYSATPPGSVFALFGQNLATRPAGAVTTTLPTELLTTTVTVNGEQAPLFYVDPQQIDAQMPWDIPGNSIATVIVTNGTSVSNAAAVYVPATGTPGIGVFGNNRAVVVNADDSVNTASAPAAVGDEVVVYFTGGGPVQASGPLVKGTPAPGGLSPVTGNNSVTVGGVQATVLYMGLTPGSIGLYQANFDVPAVAKGTFPVVITIAGQASNNPVMNVSN